MNSTKKSENVYGELKSIQVYDNTRYQMQNTEDNRKQEKVLLIMDKLERLNQTMTKNDFEIKFENKEYKKKTQRVRT